MTQWLGSSCHPNPATSDSAKRLSAPNTDNKIVGLGTLVQRFHYNTRYSSLITEDCPQENESQNAPNLCQQDQPRGLHFTLLYFSVESLQSPQCTTNTQFGPIQPIRSVRGKTTSFTVCEQFSKYLLDFLPITFLWTLLADSGWYIIISPHPVCGMMASSYLKVMFGDLVE